MIAEAMLALCLGQSPGIAEAAPTFGHPRTFYLATVMVDGVPVYRPEEMIWNGCDWIYADSDEGVEVRRGIHPDCMEPKE